MTQTEWQISYEWKWNVKKDWIRFGWRDHFYYVCVCVWWRIFNFFLFSLRVFIIVVASGCVNIKIFFSIFFIYHAPKCIQNIIQGYISHKWIWCVCVWMCDKNIFLDCLVYFGLLLESFIHSFIFFSCQLKFLVV